MIFRQIVILSRNEKQLVELRGVLWEMNTIASMYFSGYVDTKIILTDLLQPIINLMKYYREEIERENKFDQIK